MNDLPSEQYLVLEDHVAHADFLRLAQRQGWTLAKTYPSEGERVPYEEVWVDADRAHAIHFIDDPISGTRHLRLRGPDLERLIRVVVGPLAIYPPEELIEEVDEPLTEDESIAALFRLAVTFARYDPRVEQIFAAHLKHPHAMVRKAAIQALGYRSWPSSAPLVRDAAAQETDPSVKAFAERLYAEMRSGLQGPGA